MDLLNIVMELDIEYYFGADRFDAIYDRIRYLICQKRDSRYSTD